MATSDKEVEETNQVYLDNWRPSYSRQSQRLARQVQRTTSARSHFPCNLHRKRGKQSDAGNAKSDIRQFHHGER